MSEHFLFGENLRLECSRRSAEVIHGKETSRAAQVPFPPGERHA